VKIKAWVPGARDATRTVSILYRVRRGLASVDEHDELYWNVTGDEWAVPIREAEAVVSLPASLPPESVHALAFTGPRGAAGEAWSLERAGRSLTFRTTRPLRPREGLTVAVAWPPGHVHRSLWREARWFLGDNWPLGLPVVVLAVAFVLWRAWGRDPGLDRSVKPEYAPPTGLTPAEAGALIDERAEPRDVSATLLDLAVRGHLRVEEAGEPAGSDFRFHRLPSPEGGHRLRRHERLLLDRIFAGGAAEHARLSDVRRDYDAVFPPVRDAVYEGMVADGLFPASPERVRGRAVTSALGLGLSGLVVLGFARVMPRKSWRGVQMLVHVRGFQEFLERAEKDRLARLPKDALHRWLPWAVALGVSERWILGFEGLEVDPPAWYTGREPFTLAGYDASVSRLARQIEQAFATTRRSGGAGSGFSGGSSGGGLGGGGGGTF
jgi:hypothetical protein